jgi:alpha,alpha-trehalase
MSRAFITVFACLLAVSVTHAQSAPAVRTPAELYGQLFVDVQLGEVFSDSKTFVDAVPRRAPADIVARYEVQRREAQFDLRKFVATHFDVPEIREAQYVTARGRHVRDHIDALWDVLTRKPLEEPPHSSRLALPASYVVPGGRFREIYYWDSYFTMLGLQASGRGELIAAMNDNFAFLIDRYGHIPNGNRTYYVSRSQPPFFAAMVELEAEIAGAQVYAKRLPQLRREYAFWMDGAEGLERGKAHRRVVRLESGELLNRYWDDRDTPREESYREDVATAKSSNRPAPEVFRNLRAAAESGWDFSSRWLADGKSLASIRTVEVVPPDLNSLIYHLEITIARGCETVRDAACVKDMNARATHRKAAIARYLWDADAGAFTDYDWKADVSTRQITAATVYPLFFRIADDEQAARVARTLREKLLTPRGVATTAAHTGQQWDAPNGWAPLQWMAIAGLQKFDEAPLADVIAQRWVSANLAVYARTGKLVEKYDLSGTGEGGGGEYPLQDGFGWTNGVLRKLLAIYPALAEHGAVYR